jgi:hypothetical protein
MTRKQFEWLREHQPIEVGYFRPYEGKEPKEYHSLHPNKIEMEIRGEYFIFSGTYHTWNGKNFVQHHARFKIHYRNVRELIYRRTRQGE